MNGASHSTAPGSSLNGSTSSVVFITRYCLVHFFFLFLWTLSFTFTNSSSEQNPPLTVKLLDSSKGNVSWRNNTFCQNAAPCCQNLLKKELTEQIELKFYGDFQEQRFLRTFKQSQGVFMGNCLLIKLIQIVP